MFDKILAKLWEALTPMPSCNPTSKTWLAQVYDSIRPVGGLGSLIWQALGPDTIRLIHQHTDIDRIRTDFDEVLIDEQSIFILSEAEKTKRARQLEISLLAKVRQKADDPRYVELGKRLEQLRDKYEAGVLSSIEWRKALLDAARTTVNLDNGAAAADKLITDNKTALSALFQEVRNDQTLEIISSIVDDIDSIVKATRFPGWQTTSRGEREIKQVLRKTLLKYQLHKDTELFLTSTLSHLKALILFAINLKLHTTAFAFLKVLLLFLLGFYHNSGFIRFGLNSAQIQLFYAALSCAPAWRLQRYKSLVARA